ncbi:lipid II flippase MurJ [Paraburkholderia sp. A2WS-5]|uniref:murein biosynthesis integral membrane protein MurJ n=1 Tax=Paraburkholderia sp. A2WS-5 TaxID=3028372 RepID=UPI003B7BA662
MKRAIVLMLVTGINIVALFIYQWYVVVALGAGVQSDAAFASMVLPQLLLNVVSGSLSFVLVPMLATTADSDKLNAEVSNFLAALGLLFGTLAIGLFLAAPLWVPLTVPGFSEEGKAITVSLARIQLIGMFFTGIGAVPTSAYQARHRFVYPAASATIASVLSAAFLFVALPRLGVAAAAWGLALRSFLQFVFQLPVAFPLMRPDWRDEKFRDALRKLRPLIFGTSYYKTDQLVDRLLVSMAPAGVLSLLHLAQQMYAAANQVFVTALAAPAVPVLAGQASSGDQHAFRQKMMQTMKTLMLLGALVFALIVFPGYYVFELVFGHGKLTPNEIRELWLIMIAFGGFWMMGLSGQILSTSFFAMSDTTTPTKVGVIGFTIGIALKIAGFMLFGVWGVAISTGVYMAFNSLVMYWILNRRLRAGFAPAIAHRSAQ